MSCVESTEMQEDPRDTFELLLLIELSVPAAPLGIVNSGAGRD